VLELQAAAGLAEWGSVAPAPDGHVSRGAPTVFRRDGEFWTISYEGKGLRVKDAKGLQYIARLLRHPGVELHVADLAAGGEAGSSLEPARGGAAGAIVAGLGDAGGVLDAPARAAYRQQLQDLEAELAEATSGPTRAEQRSSAPKSSSCARSCRPPTGSAGGRARPRTRATGRAKPSPAASARASSGSGRSTRRSRGTSRTRSTREPFAATDPTGRYAGSCNGPHGAPAPPARPRPPRGRAAVGSPHHGVEWTAASRSCPTCSKPCPRYALQPDPAGGDALLGSIDPLGDRFRIRADVNR
jgi:hypothetical protein